MDAKRASLVVLSVAVTAALGISGAQAEETARDLRTQTRTRWDYQPGQGPRNAPRDEDYFRPGGSPNVAAPVPPRPEVVPGDWRDPPPPKVEVPPAPVSYLPRTISGIDVGIQGSNYHYHEPSVGVKINGPRLGLMAEGTGVYKDWFGRVNLRVSLASVDYKGSGELKDQPDTLVETQGNIGRDFVWSHFGVSPYTGVGYRYLFNDIRGKTTTGAYGYRRESHYLYIPVGVQPRMTLPNGARLALKTEYDQLIWGKQVSSLSDVSRAYPDLENTQRGGFGVRGDLMYEGNGWAVGPYANYWRIRQSMSTCAWGQGNGVFMIYECGYEPTNHTLEYGLQVRYQLY